MKLEDISKDVLSKEIHDDFSWLEKEGYIEKTGGERDGEPLYTATKKGLEYYSHRKTNYSD